MKEQIIQIPDTFEIKEIKDGKIILVEKEKKLTYEDIARKLFPDGETHFYFDSNANINTIVTRKFNCTCKNNATSKKQIKKLLAINMLMNVAKYLNDGWQPNWNNSENKHYIYSNGDNLRICSTVLTCSTNVYFKSTELVEKAIEILGEEIIKLALCTDY